MQIRKATTDDVNAIARLAVMAGEGLPAWFRAQSAQPGQAIEAVGAARLYQRLGYRIRDSRPVVPHESHPYNGRIMLLTRPVPS
jgi:hypothetical protein